MAKKSVSFSHLASPVGLTRAYIACVLIMLTFLLWTGAFPAQSEDSAQLPKRLIDLERESKLDEALRLIKEDKKVESIHQKHLEHLEETIRTFRLVEAYHQLGENGLAQDELKKLISTFRPQEDEYLLAAGLKKLAELQTEIKNAVDQQARDLVADGDAYQGLKLYDKALASYEASARLNPSDKVVQDIRKKIIEAEMARAHSQSPGYWNAILHNIVSGLKTILEWLAYIGAALAISFLIWKLRKRRSPSDETIITLQDLTAQGPDREAANQLLTQEFLLETRILAGGRIDPLDESGEDRAILPGPSGQLASEFTSGPELEPEKSLSTLASISELPARFSDVDKLIQDGTPVKFGPLAFSPKQLFAFLASYTRRPPRYTLVGSLTGGQGGLMLTIRRLGRNNKPMSTKLWRAVGSGSNARTEVVRDVAAQVAVEICQVTTDWRSLRDYRKALGALANESGEDRGGQRQEEALQWLGRSLYFDPSNWIARFNMAIVLHNLGRFEDAIEQLKRLQEMAGESARRAHPALSRCLQHSPEFEPIIRYNQGACFARLKAWEYHKEAINILESVIEWAKVDALPSESKALKLYKQKARLEMLGRSALASSLNFELEQLGTGKRLLDIDQKRRRLRQDNIIKKIMEIRAWFQNLPPERIRLHPREYTLSSGIVEHAVGRAYHLLNRHADSIKALRRAIAIDPSQVEGYVDLALAHLKIKQAPDWQRQVEENLVKALGLNPFNQKAHYLLGQLYVHPSMGQYEAAKDHFKKCGLAPWGLFQLAKIQGDRDLNYSEALDSLRKSLAIFPQSDVRTQCFIVYALKLFQKTQDLELLDEARQHASRLSRKSEDPALRRKGSELLGQLTTIIQSSQKEPLQRTC